MTFFFAGVLFVEALAAELDFFLAGALVVRGEAGSCAQPASGKTIETRRESAASLANQLRNGTPT